MLKVTASVFRVMEEVPPVLKYIVGDLFLIKSKRARGREPSLNFDRRGKVINQAVEHEHKVLGIGDMMKVNLFIALFNPRGNQEQNFQYAFLHGIDR